jgi:SAM-dependent methyltransferase
MMPKKQWNAKELLKLSGSYWESSTLHNAVQLDVFSILAETGLTAQETATKMDVPEDGLCRLLNALTAMGLLIKTGAAFSLTKESKNYLWKGSPQYMGYIISHHQNLSTSWSRMHEAITSGKPFRSSVKELDEKSIESFLMGMHNISSVNAPFVVDKVDLSTNRHFLDLGGGPGTYAIQFCKQFPQLKATLFDLPTSRSYAEKNIASHGYSDRIHFTAGDFNSDPIPGTYDVVWMSHILHSEGDTSCRKLIKKAASILKPGGKIMIHEFILDNDGTSPCFPALFSINMFLHTERGKSYTQQQLKAMLKENGITGIQRIQMQTPTESGIIWGKKAI